jgi:hypothetical protein
MGNYTVDAFGTLILPSGSYQALRITHESISKTISPFMTTQSRSYTYEFQSKSGYMASVSIDSAQYGKATVVPQYIYYNIAGATGVEQSRGGGVPESFALDQNYPNPFNPSTTIKYELPRASHVVLKVFNTLGQEVVTLVDAVEEPGYKSVQFDASLLSSGVYFYRFEAGDFVSVKKLLVLR